MLLLTAAAVTVFWPAIALQAAQPNPEKLSLWPDRAPVGDGTFETTTASITVYRPSPEKANGAAMVICPGGGYAELMIEPEGHGIARWLNQHGITGVVLEYRFPRGRAFVPLLDVQRAIRTVRFKAKQWGVRSDRIGIIGFSAGGHLASTAGTHFDNGYPLAADPVDRESCRPDFAVLIYPVITMGEKTNGGTMSNLLGRDPKPEMVDLFSNEKHVTDKTPPTFLAYAKDDTVVVPENSRMFYEALKAHNVAAEYLELPSGGHGLNHYQGPMWDAWQSKSMEWLVLQMKLSPSSAATAQDERFVPLFDGKTLDGWQIENCDVTVQDGCMLLQGGNGWIHTVKEYGDFVLELDFKPLKKDLFDSGVFIRAEERPEGANWPELGQINLNQHMFGKIQEIKEAVARPELALPGAWNHMRVTVVGTIATLEMNGKQAWTVCLRKPVGHVAFPRGEPASCNAASLAISKTTGYIGFQCEVPSGGQFLIRNVHIGLPGATAGIGSFSAVGIPTVYKIRNRMEQFLFDAGGKVGYDKSDGESDNRKWVLEDARGEQRIKNLGSGMYLAAEKGDAEAMLVNRNGSDAVENACLWAIDDISGPWRSIKSRANGNYLNCEDQRGRAECDNDQTPDDENWWLSQWEFVYAGGPLPPKHYRLRHVSVAEPAYGAAVNGDTSVAIRAPGLTRATVKCWKQGEGFGADSTVATVGLDASGAGSFVFPAKAFPHGPITVRIIGTDGKTEDTCYLQLYNTVGVRWNEGIPTAAPPQAKDMSLVFADDFSGRLSISKDGRGAAYCSHKPGGGDFSSIPFADHESTRSPFSQVDTYLRIRADAEANTAGMISSLRMDGSGITAKAPCYFECRMLAPSAPGSWPGFWLMTSGIHKGLAEPADELETFEAFGGDGPRSPHQTGYWICTHCWNQGEAGKKQPGIYKQVPMTVLGGGASWATTFHVYGAKVTPTDTIYYCDNVEVGRHPTGELGKTEPLCFFVNLATGGGWPVDLARYDGVVDMYVDWVRVYSSNVARK